MTEILGNGGRCAYLANGAVLSGFTLANGSAEKGGGAIHATLVVTQAMAIILNDDTVTLYVNVNSPNPVPPYTNWATAAATIQDAIDATGTGDEIVVTNGVYARGGRSVFGTMTNRLAVTRRLTVRSVNGPEVTVIAGYQVPDTRNGDGAIRCAWLQQYGLAANGSADYVDTDGDGFNNWQEWQAGTDPRNAISSPRLLENRLYRLDESRPD